VRLNARKAQSEEHNHQQSLLMLRIKALVGHVAFFLIIPYAILFLKWMLLVLITQNIFSRHRC
jgi:hypothetical protein